MAEPLLAVAEGKPLADRTVEPLDPLQELIARPVRGVQMVELAPPGPATRQGRVQVPVMPGGGR